MRKYDMKNRGLREDGFASIVVGLILVIVMGLLTVGFAQLSRHEEQQALGSQLATQAYYAAESGINDALTDITTINPATDLPYINGQDASSTECMTPDSTGLPLTALTANPIINGPDAVSYSCLLVNLNLPFLEFKDVGVEQSENLVTNAEFEGLLASLRSLTISWGDPNDPNIFSPDYPKLLPTGAWAYPGVIEFSITPIAAGNINQTTLAANTFTVYAYPSAGGANEVIDAPGNQGEIVPGDCDAAADPAYPCSITINGLPDDPNQYLIHFINYYAESNVYITGVSSEGPPTTFSGGQVQLDVTGKAKDVLKRVDVTVTLNPNTNLPNYALEAQNICKRELTNPVGTTFETPAGAVAGAGTACDGED
jgi:hypothetical protein